MQEVSIAKLEAYLQQLYPNAKEESLFMKLVEEVGEVAEVLNKRSGRKASEINSDEVLANELVDIIHYAVAIAAINNIDLTTAMIEKDKQASIKYNHQSLEEYLK